jgi:voltage-gated sodium channel
MSQRTESALGMVIFCNMFVVIEETNLRAAETEIYLWLRIVAYAMTFVYMVELAVRFYVFRCGFWQNPWNVFDFIIVSVDIMSELMSFVMDLPSVAFLRVLRLVRLTRAIRILLAFPELYMIIKGIAGAAKTIIWGFGLVLGVLTLYSIVAVTVIHPINQRITDRGYYEDCERCPRAFSSVWHSILTFCQQIVAGDSWGQVSTPIVEEEPWTFFFFLMVLVSINLGLMNLMLAVIVDRAHEAHLSDMAHLAKMKVKQQESAHKKLVQMCADMDNDASGTVSLVELKEGFHTHPEFAQTLHVMDIKECDLDMVFGILDTDGSGDVDYVEFADQLHAFKAQDERTLLVFIKHYVVGLHQRLATIQKAQEGPCSPSSPSARAKDDEVNVTKAQHFFVEDANSSHAPEVVHVPSSPLYNPRDPVKPVPPMQGSRHNGAKSASSNDRSGESNGLSTAISDELRMLRSSHEEFTAALRDIAKKWENHAEVISSIKADGTAASARPSAASSPEKLREVLPLPLPGDGEIHDAVRGAESEWRKGHAPRMIFPTCCSTIRVPPRALERC